MSDNILSLYDLHRKMVGSDDEELGKDQRTSFCLKLVQFYDCLEPDCVSEAQKIICSFIYIHRYNDRLGKKDAVKIPYEGKWTAYDKQLDFESMNFPSVLIKIIKSYVDSIMH